MKKKITALFICTWLLLIFFTDQTVAYQATHIKTAPTDSVVHDIPAAYKTETLIVQKLSDRVYQHTSFLKTKDFGLVPCNGMLVITNNEAVIFDTPADIQSSKELIAFVATELQCKIKAVIATHFHDDCVAGLDEFSKLNIPSYASNRTIQLLKAKDKTFLKPIRGFKTCLVLDVGDEKIYSQYIGEGHTPDNVVGYFPKDNILFGGCLIKEVGASKGNLEDANVKQWAQTVRRLKEKYPRAKVVIPGHGKYGGTELLDYTIQLFE